MYKIELNCVKNEGAFVELPCSGDDFAMLPGKGSPSQSTRCVIFLLSLNYFMIKITLVNSILLHTFN
jgi:hypothetical protein